MIVRGWFVYINSQCSKKEIKQHKNNNTFLISLSSLFGCEKEAVPEKGVEHVGFPNHVHTITQGCNIRLEQ